MERLVDKGIIGVCCLAAFALMPVDFPVLIGFLCAVTIAALAETLPRPVGIGFAAAYCLAAAAVPSLTTFLPLIVYDCMRDDPLSVKTMWTIPLVIALFSWRTAPLVFAILLCVVAIALSRRTAALAEERREYRILRDALRESMLETARAEKPLGMHDFFLERGLTEREAAIAELVAQGMGNREIAQTVCASEGTVRNHVSSILQKLEVGNRTQIALAYYQNR